jgi:hypothetical protein
MSSASIPREFSSDSPFSNTGISTKNPLDLIRGYENEPLVSLEEALGSFHGKIVDLADYIREAKTKCYYPAKPKLTLDESAAIYIYTMKWDDGCLYDHMQEAWKSEDPSELRPWFKYLKLFKSAFDKLPKTEGEIWQGKPFDDRLEGEINSNLSSLYLAMDIFSPSKSFVEQSLHDSGVKEKIFIRLKSVGGKLAREYAASNWNEYLVWPGMKLVVSDIDTTSESGSVTYHITASIRKYHFSLLVVMQLTDTTFIFST